MAKLSPSELRQRVVVACTALQEKGFKLRTALWGFSIRVNGDDVSVVERVPEVMACCALGALAIYEDLHVNADDLQGREEFLAKALGIKTGMVRSFVEGFDNKEHTGESWGHQEWYDCGQSVYTELIGSKDDT